MTARLLQILGVGFVLLLVAGSIAGFGVLKDRVRVVVMADADTGPDPTALLRDDLRVLAQDQRALQAALASNFERLANGLEERAGDRHADVQAQVGQVAAQLKALRTLLDQQAQQLAVLRADLAAVQEPGAARPRSLAAAAGDPAAGAVPERVMDAAPPTPALEPIAAAPTVEPPSAATPKPGFLSFDLPTTRFAFDAPQDYALLPELCRVGFDAKSTLHDFTGVTSDVHGGFRADFDAPDGAWSGEIRVAARTLRTGVDGRDSNMREHLDTEHFPELRYTIERFVPAADGIDVAKQTARGEVRGTMTIRGQTRPFAMPVAVAVDPQRRVVVTGQAPLRLSDYGVPVPSQLGVINMQDEVQVWIALRARVRGEAVR